MPVLKGKYYPNGDYMTTRKKKNASHTWRAILSGRPVLEMVLIHRIGNGTSTNIWIPNGVGMKPICRVQGTTASQVLELFDQSVSWDEEALSVNLIPMGARAVRCIPLSMTYEDFWAWTGEKYSNYSVRSAYRLLWRRHVRRKNIPRANPHIRMGRTTGFGGNYGTARYP
jgi:hypothetical protein